MPEISRADVYGECLYCIVFIYYQIIQELQGLTMTMNKLIMNIW